MSTEPNEDLARKISTLLSDPGSLERLRTAASAFGLGDLTPSAPDAPTKKPDPPDQPASAAGLPDLGMLGNLLPLLKDFNKDDENITLLRSLRPYLHGEREKRLDESIKMLQLMRMLPLLQERGLF